MKLPKPYFERDGIVIYHGDCLKILPKLKAGSVDAVVTDPPYGIDYQSARRTDKDKRHKKIANDIDPFIDFIQPTFVASGDPGCILCFCRWDVQIPFYETIISAGFDVKAQIIWDREHHGMGDLDGAPAPQHDVIWLGVKGSFKLRGSKRPKSVIRSRRLSGSHLRHPNEKPIKLMINMIADYSNQGDLILDPFMGSGTTLVACVRTGRKAIGIELEEKYCEIAAKRIEKEQRTPRLISPEVLHGEKRKKKKRKGFFD